MTKKRGTLYPFGKETPPFDWLKPYHEDPRYNHIDILGEAENFRDRALAGKDGKEVRYLDWRAAWRMWMRNTLKWNPKPAIGTEGPVATGNWQEYARRNGISALAGESWQDFQRRVEDEMRRAAKPPQEDMFH